MFFPPSRLHHELSPEQVSTTQDVPWRQRHVRMFFALTDPRAWASSSAIPSITARTAHGWLGGSWTRPRSTSPIRPAPRRRGCRRAGPRRDRRRERMAGLPGALLIARSGLDLRGPEPLDRAARSARKMPIYAREGVRRLAGAPPLQRTLEDLHARLGLQPGRRSPPPTATRASAPRPLPGASGSISPCSGRPDRPHFAAPLQRRN